MLFENEKNHNLSTAGAIPTFDQFAVPPPSSIANLPGLDTVFEPRSAAAQQYSQPAQVNYAITAGETIFTKLFIENQ